MKSQNGYRALNVKEHGGYRTFEQHRTSVLDCKQTSFRVPAGTGINSGSWEVFFDFLNQFFDCMMKKFTSTQSQIKRLLTDQLELRKTLNLLTKR